MISSFNNIKQLLNTALVADNFRNLTIVFLLFSTIYWNSRCDRKISWILFHLFSVPALFLRTLLCQPFIVSLWQWVWVAFSFRFIVDTRFAMAGGVQNTDI